MTRAVEMPLWALVLLLLFAAVTFASHFLFPSVRWFFRRRMERVVTRLNQRLERPIEPFKLARRYDMIQRLIYDPEVSQAVAEHAQTEGIPENVAFEQAKRYAREIVPGFSASAYFGVAIKLAKWLSSSLYRVRLGHFDEASLSKVDKDATVVFVMNHRSNMDYVLVTWLAAERSALSYAVGEWARVWPLSKLIKAMGAYFIRRKSRNDLYRKVLARYVGLATDGGVTQAMFPEGGLSLDGKLAPPKLGLLKYIVEGRNDEGRDVVFVPVAVNYDRVFEDRILVAAGQRGERRFRARISVITRFIFRQIRLRITGKYHRHGYAAASFGAPVSLNEFRRSHPRGDVKDLARLLMTRIGEEVPVLPVPLVARALIRSDGQMRLDELQAEVERMMTELPQAHIHMPRDDGEYAVEVGLRNLVKRKLVEDRDGQITLIERQRPIVAYYAASIEHLFRTRSE
ncbi:1-acyl-sn-glycerol-3-phosphate acyltransferase [Roseovarius aestuarii]|uniref:Glycerol-3-phosphate acyltransferase n=1 Tax=Roseovarius aestuarii TaxID=475083 RepID=A0A1X7BRR2_9RHOB|nr:1-acyl-sn-glycerol-3-phosphate acyltransferase [Roseovarius aestuarii]SMC12293.1 Glycerol-3-phosphate acyltransferase [Roseovarius aestuarii]